MGAKRNQIYFSVSFDLLSVNEKLQFDLYINSSTNSTAHFVRILPKGELLTQKDLSSFKRKYNQLYISESQRKNYMDSLMKNPHFDKVEKTDVVKKAAIEYLDKIFESEHEFTTEVLVQTVEGCRDVVENMIDVVEDYKLDGLQKLIGSLSFHDFYTYDHSINVSMYCIAIFKLLHPHASKKQMISAGLGGLLHDLGKIKVPTEILNNPGKLTDEQFSIIKQHPDFGLALINQGEVELSSEIDLESIKRVVYEHHENWNGTGYPKGLKEEEISEHSRICAIADFFDAITTKRSYADVLGIDEAIKVMEKTRGTKLDPKMFDIFASQFKKQITKTPFPFQMKEDFDSEKPYKEFPLEEIKDSMDVSFRDKNNKERSSKVNLFGGKKKAS